MDGSSVNELRFEIDGVVLALQSGMVALESMDPLMLMGCAEQCVEDASLVSPCGIERQQPSVEDATVTL